jgi:hypothetical protein
MIGVKIVNPPSNQDCTKKGDQKDKSGVGWKTTKAMKFTVGEGLSKHDGGILPPWNTGLPQNAWIVRR